MAHIEGPVDACLPLLGAGPEAALVSSLLHPDWVHWLDLELSPSAGPCGCCVTLQDTHTHTHTQVSRARGCAGVDDVAAAETGTCGGADVLK